MAIHGPNEINSSSIKALPNTENIDIRALFPTKLSEPVTLEQFENGAKRVQASYATHGAVAKTAHQVEQGLSLSYELNLPLTTASRAIRSATARLKNS